MECHGTIPSVMASFTNVNIVQKCLQSFARFRNKNFSRIHRDVSFLFVKANQTNDLRKHIPVTKTDIRKKSSAEIRVWLARQIYI